MNYEMKALKYIDLIDKIIQTSTNRKKNMKRVNKIRNRILKKDKDNRLLRDFDLIKSIILYAELSDNEKIKFFFDMLEQDAYIMEEDTFFYNGNLEDERKEMDKISRKYIINEENRKKGYQILRKHYYERKRVLKKDVEMIEKALSLLKVSNGLITIIIKILQNRVLEKEEIRKNRKVQNEATRISLDPLNWKFEIKPMLSEKEWKVVKQEVKKYYDLDSKVAIKALDIKEKIELVKLLLKLRYNEEEIKVILWQIDEQFPMKNLSNSNQTMRNVRIIKMVIEKTKMQLSNDLEILHTINEIIELKNQSKDKEQSQWNELLLETIDQENREFKCKLQAKYEEVKKINGNQKKQWRDIFLEEIEYEKHSSLTLFQIIFENLKTCPKEERASWKQRLLDTLTRMQLECTGNYEYEIEEAKRVRIKGKK